MEAGNERAETCENCGRPVLPTDITCWHCGYRLPRQPKQASAKAKPSPETGRRPRQPAKNAVAAEESYDLRAIAIYGALTVLIIIALVVVMLALGRYPILVRSASLALGSDWVAVTDADLRYTVSLPEEWQWFDMAYRDQSASIGAMIDRQPYVNRALRPLGDSMGDVDIIAAAFDAVTLENTEPKPFVIIGRSERARALAPQDVLDRLAEEPLPATEQAIDRRLAGQPQARFNILDLTRDFQCRYLFVADEQTAGYLVAACAPQSRFGTVQRDLANILDSFQLLQP